VAKKSKSIASKVMVAAKKREKELLYLQAQIKSCDLPVMVTGDFNEPPTSFAYTSLIQQLNDPFNTYGFGLQPTFDGIKNLPGLRLDHVLTDTNLITTSYQIGPAALSDHRPVVITFHFAK
jgi:endonuclease/exonuclease/phosphatase (EEP) superfamily protein YafD